MGEGTANDNAKQMAKEKRRLHILTPQQMRAIEHVSTKENHSDDWTRLTATNGAYIATILLQRLVHQQFVAFMAMTTVE
jgi:aminoglycoside phosphotransferase